MEHADHDKCELLIDRVLDQIDTISAHPELPIDLMDHLCGSAAVILRLRSLFGDESGCTYMCLGVNGLALALILLANLLLGQSFLPLPLRRWEDTGIKPTHRDDRSSRLIRRACF